MVAAGSKTALGSDPMSPDLPNESIDRGENSSKDKNKGKRQLASSTKDKRSRGQARNEGQTRDSGRPRRSGDGEWRREERATKHSAETKGSRGDDNASRDRPSSAEDSKRSPRGGQRRRPSGGEGRWGGAGETPLEQTVRFAFVSLAAYMASHILLTYVHGGRCGDPAAGMAALVDAAAPPAHQVQRCSPTGSSPGFCPGWASDSRRPPPPPPLPLCTGSNGILQVQRCSPTGSSPGFCPGWASDSSCCST